METTSDRIEPLLERVEKYTSASIELMKLKLIDKSADILSMFISHLLIIIIALLFAVILNIAAALWLGELLGKNYYGFLVVAAFNALLAISMLLMKSFVKTRINNVIISNILK